MPVYFQELVITTTNAEEHQRRINELFIKYTKKNNVKKFIIIANQTYPFKNPDRWESWITLELVGIIEPH